MVKMGLVIIIVQGSWRDDSACNGLTTLGQVGGNRYISLIS